MFQKLSTIPFHFILHKIRLNAEFLLPLSLFEYHKEYITILLRQIYKQASIAKRASPEAI